jgi:hypothetical protein
MKMRRAQFFLVWFILWLIIWLKAKWIKRGGFYKIYTFRIFILFYVPKKDKDSKLLGYKKYEPNFAERSSVNNKIHDIQSTNF